MGFKKYWSRNGPTTMTDRLDALKIPTSLEVWEVKGKTLYLLRAPQVNDIFILDNQIFQITRVGIQGIFHDSIFLHAWIDGDSRVPRLFRYVVVEGPPPYPDVSDV